MQCAGEDQSQMDSLFMNARCSCGKDMKTGLFPLHRLPTLRLALKSTAIRDGLTNIYHLLVCFCFGLVCFMIPSIEIRTKRNLSPKKRMEKAKQRRMEILCPEQTAGENKNVAFASPKPSRDFVSQSASLCFELRLMRCNLWASHALDIHLFARRIISQKIAIFEGTNNEILISQLHPKNTCSSNEFLSPLCRFVKCVSNWKTSQPLFDATSLFFVSHFASLSAFSFLICYSFL